MLPCLEARGRAGAQGLKSAVRSAQKAPLYVPRLTSGFCGCSCSARRSTAAASWCLPRASSAAAQQQLAGVNLSAWGARHAGGRGTCQWRDQAPGGQHACQLAGCEALPCLPLIYFQGGSRVLYSGCMSAQSEPGDGPGERKTHRLTAQPSAMGIAYSLYSPVVINQMQSSCSELTLTGRENLREQRL